MTEELKTSEAAASMAPATNKRWYVVHAYSGMEKAVERNLRERIDRSELQSKFGRILVPMEEVGRAEERQEVGQRAALLPGLRARRDGDGRPDLAPGEAHQQGHGFVGGAKNRPSPISEAEVMKIVTQMQEGVEKPRPKVQWEVGETVRIKEGPFTDFNGAVEDVNYDKSKVRVSVTIFGRATPVELDFAQVERSDSFRCGPGFGPLLTRSQLRLALELGRSAIHGQENCRLYQAASPAGKANPSPPIGPALGQRGLNIMEFCKAFNAQTSSMEPGLVLPVVITAFRGQVVHVHPEDPAGHRADQKALKLDKGSAKPHLDKVGKLTRAQVEEIAKTKQKDLTGADLNAAVRTIAGTARSMGITVEGVV